MGNVLNFPFGDVAGLPGKLDADGDDVLVGIAVWEAIVFVFDLSKGVLSGAVELDFEHVNGIGVFYDRIDAAVSGFHFGVDIHAQESEDHDEKALIVFFLRDVQILVNSGKQTAQSGKNPIEIILVKTYQKISVVYQINLQGRERCTIPSMPIRGPLDLRPLREFF